MPAFQKRLKELEKSWRGAKPDQDKAFERMKDGEYRFLITRAEIGESKNEDNPRLQVAWEFRCIKGQLINKTTGAWDGLDSERGLAAIKGRLKVMGVKPPNRLADLPEALEKVLDRKCVAKLTTRGKFQNLTIIRRLKKKKVAEEPIDVEEGL